MQNLHICLRSAGVLFVFGIVYHPKKNNRLKWLKMKNKKIAPDFTTKSDFSVCPCRGHKRKFKMVKNATKIKNF